MCNVRCIFLNSHSCIHVHKREVEVGRYMYILRSKVENTLFKAGYLSCLLLRPDLKVILMSATLNAQLFSQYFGEWICDHTPIQATNRPRG